MTIELFHFNSVACEWDICTVITDGNTILKVQSIIKYLKWVIILDNAVLFFCMLFNNSSYTYKNIKMFSL